MYWKAWKIAIYLFYISGYEKKNCTPPSSGDNVHLWPKSKLYYVTLCPGSQNGWSSGPLVFWSHQFSLFEAHYLIPTTGVGCYWKKKKAEAEKLETFQVIYNLFIWKQIFNKLLWQRNCLKQTCSCFLQGKFLVANFLLAGNLLYFPPLVDWTKSDQREWSHLNLRRCCSTKWNQGLSAEWHISQFENHTKIIYLSVKTIK